MNDKRAAVRRLQEYLRRIECAHSGLPLILTDGVYDERTADAVKRFQKSAGLPVTGKADAGTWDAIFSEYRRLGDEVPAGIDPFLLCGDGDPIGEGSAGDTVMMLKLLLRAMAPYYSEFSDVGTDGTYDEATGNAVRSFQKKNGVAPSGRVDAATWNSLCAAYRSAVHHFEG